MMMIIDLFSLGYQMRAPMENIDSHVVNVNLTLADEEVSHLALLY